VPGTNRPVEGASIERSMMARVLLGAERLGHGQAHVGVVERRGGHVEHDAVHVRLADHRAAVVDVGPLFLAA